MLEYESRVHAPSKALLWTGRVLSALPVLLLLFSAWMKLSKAPQAVDGFKQMGYPDYALLALGITEAACAIIYAIPQTAVLGAILVVGYLGGATDVHVRTQTSFAAPVIAGVLAWLGLLLREPRLRSLLPFRKLNG